MKIKFGNTVLLDTRAIKDGFHKVKNSIALTTRGFMPNSKDITVWNMWEHKGYADRIAWLQFDDQKQKLEGHIGEFGKKVKEGDELRCKMQSGKIAKFEIRNLEYQSDPRDQFFADAIFLGYLEGVEHTGASDARGTFVKS